MKTHQFIKQVVTCIIGLTLISCGGGGGGGGNDDGGDATTGNTSQGNNTPPSPTTGLAPDGMYVGQKITMTLTLTSQVTGTKTQIDRFTVSSLLRADGTRALVKSDYSGISGTETAYYEKTGANTATFTTANKKVEGYNTYTSNSIYKLVFSSKTSGTIASWEYINFSGVSKVFTNVGTFTTTVKESDNNASGGSTSGGGNSSSNSGSTSTPPATTDYAPTDITGYWISFPQTTCGVKEVLLDIGGSAIITPSTFPLGNTYEYKKTEKNKGTLKVICPRTPSQNLDVTLTFTSNQKVNVTGKIGSSQVNVASTYSTGHASSEWNPPSGDGPTGSGGNGGNNNNTGNDSVSGYAPASLDGYYFSTSNYSTINGIRKIGFAGSKVTIAPANVSGSYTYTRSSTNGNEARLTLDCPGTSHDSNGELTLTYTSASTLRLTGKINGSIYNLELNMARGKVEIDEPEDTPPPSEDTLSAPASLAGLTFINTKDKEYLTFKADGTVEQGPTDENNWKATGTYTYSKSSYSSTKGSLYYNITSSTNSWREYINGTLTLEFRENNEARVQGTKVFVHNGESTQYSIDRIDSYSTSSSGSGGGNSSGSDDSGSSDSSGSSTTQSYAPISLDGKIIALTSGITSLTNAQLCEFSDGKVTIMPAGVSGTYSYRKSSANGNNATLSFDCTGTQYDTDGNLTLKFTSATTGTLHGKIGSLSYNTAGFTLESGTLPPGGSTDTDDYPSTLAVGTSIEFHTSINIFWSVCACGNTCDECEYSVLKITGTNTATISSQTGKYKLNGTFSYVPGANGAATVHFYSSSNRQSASYPMQYSSTAATGGSLTGFVSTTQANGSNKLSYKGSFKVTKP